MIDQSLTSSHSKSQGRSTGFYAPELDGLRCLAVATVMIAHFSPTLSRFADWGNLGVRLFFVLSGFLITTILLRNREKVDAGDISQSRTLVRFFVRRVFRLWPIYFLSLGLAYAAHVPGTYTNIWWHAAFATNHYIFQARDWPLLLSHFWTLAVEQQFYLIWPVIVLLIPLRFLPAVLAILALLGPLSRFALLVTGLTTQEFVGVLLPCCLDFFALGGAVAWILCHRTPVWLSKPAAPLCLLLWLGAGIVFKTWGLNLPGWPIYDGLIQAVGFAALLLFLFKNRENLVCRLLQNPTFVYLGKISYGIYIYHNFMHRLGPALLRRLTGQNYFGSETTHVFYLVALTVLIAVVSYHLFEAPLQKLGHRWS